MNISANQMGKYDFQFKNVANPTICQTPTDSTYSDRFFYATTCEPKWWRGAVTFHQQPGDISLYIPPDSSYDQLAPPAQAAARCMEHSDGRPCEYSGHARRLRRQP
jgi:hypothetical protein